MANFSFKAIPSIRLSNNMLYNFYACDSRSGDFIAALAHTMNLTESVEVGRKVFVYVSKKKIGFPGIILPGNDHEPIICRLFPASNPDIFTIQIQKIAQAVVADIICKGGTLMHGGLCSLRGYGAVMAGPGSVGKTTASNRLPSPWKSYSDDATLVIPDGTGGFNAHPWPTWSRFCQGGPGGVWDVEEGIPLAALFFLRQSKTDSLEVVDEHHAKAMIIDTIEHVTRSIRWRVKDKRDYVQKCISSADNIVSVVPAYRLAVSIEGEFWRKMEKVMPSTKMFEKPGLDVRKVTELEEQEEVHYIYRGLSMNPTFYEPELLIIEPYNGKEPKKGDIICYRVGNKDERTVHRIISVKNTLLKTKGDNNAAADDYSVDRAAVIGRVVASKSGNKTRAIYGGFAGVLGMYWGRGYLILNHNISKFLHASYHFLANTGVFRRVKPKNMNFKVVVFQRHSRKYPKLIFNYRTVGTFDFDCMTWKINRPYRLFVDEKKLPFFEMSAEI